LGLMRGDPGLLRTAIIAEFGGALVGVALTYLLGLVPFWGDPTPSLLAQTNPTLIDLLVAALAGFAGVLAMIDERISPALPGVEFSRGKGGLDVLAEVRTPHVPAPGRVNEIQDALGNSLGEPVRLFMRCTLTKDVTATGSTTLRPYLSLNGKVATAPVSADMRLLQQAEQVAREVVATRPNIVLKDVELVNLPIGPVLVVSIESPRAPSPDR